MLLIWGTKSFEEDLGASVHKIECPHCHNEVQTRVIHYGYKFSLFFLPLFPVQSNYAETCPICHASRVIGRSEIKELLE